MFVLQEIMRFNEEWWRLNFTRLEHSRRSNFLLPHPRPTQLRAAHLVDALFVRLSYFSTTYLPIHLSYSLYSMDPGSRSDALHMEGTYKLLYR